MVHSLVNLQLHDIMARTKSEAKKAALSPAALRKPRTPASGSLRKAHRFRSGTVAKREIKRLQKSVEYCLKKAPFRRLVVEVGSDIKDDLYMTEGAKDALQHACEEYLTNYFEAGYVVAEQSSKNPVSTLKPRHTRTANNVALCFPGIPVDYDFRARQEARRAAAASAIPRTKRKKSTESEKKKKTKKSSGRDSSIVSAETVPQPKVATLPKSHKDKKERKEKREHRKSENSSLLTQIAAKNTV